MSTTAAGRPRCLVTGGTGFIGRRLVRRLVADFGPDSVMCLIKPHVASLESKARDAYRAMGLRLIEADLLDQPVTAGPPPHVDIVFHLAANIDTEATETEARVNDIGTQHLIDWLRPVSSGARVVYTSSVAVHDRRTDPTGPISEESPLVPRTAYGKTKGRGEEIVRNGGVPDGYSWTILRLPTVYGPGQKHGGLFDKMIRMASDGAWLGRLDWPGRTSIIHVDDAVDVMVDLARRHEAANETICVASDESLTVGELARQVGAALGRPVTPIVLPRPLARVVRMLVWNRALQAGMPRVARVSFWRLSLMISDGFWFDTTKLRRVYRKPLRNLDEGLRDTID